MQAVSPKVRAEQAERRRAATHDGDRHEVITRRSQVSNPAPAPTLTVSLLVCRFFMPGYETDERGKPYAVCSDFSKKNGSLLLRQRTVLQIKLFDKNPA